MGCMTSTTARKARTKNNDLQRGGTAHALFHAIDTDADSYISPKELAEWLVLQHDSGNPLFQEDSKATFKKMMKVLDADRDGKVSELEFRRLINNMNSRDRQTLRKNLVKQWPKVRSDILRKLFDMVDVNNTGSISETDFAVWTELSGHWSQIGEALSTKYQTSVNKKRKGQKRNAKELDPNVEAKLSKSAKEKLWYKFDRNGDGRIVFSEFEAFFHDWKMADIRAMYSDATTKLRELQSSQSSKTTNNDKRHRRKSHGHNRRRHRDHREGSYSVSRKRHSHNKRS